MATAKFTNGAYDCIHCGERSGSPRVFCKSCGTAEGRAKVDEENKKIFAAAGKEFICEYCEREQKHKALASIRKQEEKGGVEQ